MSEAIGAALKKIAVALASNKDTAKKIGVVILAILVALITPILAIVGVLNNDIDFDSNRLEEIIIQNMTEEEKQELQHTEDTLNGIETYMTQAGHDNQKIMEAQVLYMLVLSDKSYSTDFISTLSNCFIEEQTDDELVSAVNSAFGCNINTEDFTNVVKGLRAVTIQTTNFQTPESKTNIDLVNWAKNAKNSGWGYVYGTYGNVLTVNLLNIKAEQYPDYVASNREFIEQHWLGGRVSDCVGLIKGYSWFNPETNQIEYGTNGMPDISANGMFDAAVEKGPINTIPEIPGLAVWQNGHIGIYIGNGQVIHAANTYRGVIQSELRYCGFTHWLKIPYITYVEEEQTTESTNS